MERLSISSAILVLMVTIAGVAAGTAAAGTPKTDTKTFEFSNVPKTITKTFQTSDGMIGVASVAGVTSRNGKVSSISGVHFYPSLSSQPMSFFYPNAKTGDKLPEPISFSKEENGRITSGTIKVGPGSVSVTSSARSSYPGAAKSSFPLFRSSFPEASSSSKFTKPLIDDMFFPYPLPMFNSRSFDPWFPNNMMFRQAPQPRFDAFNTAWPYPTFTPFNFW